MHPLRWLLVVFLCLPGCHSQRDEARRRLEDAGVNALRRDSALLYKELHGAAATDFTVVPKKQWPKSFRVLDPVRVGCYADGFSLALKTDADTEQGIYVVPLDFARREPAAAGLARFEPMADGVYWYEFTR